MGRAPLPLGLARGHGSQQISAPAPHFGITDTAVVKGLELYCNIEALPWLHVTPDLQVVEPSLKSIDTDVILGLRVMIDF